MKFISHALSEPEIPKLSNYIQLPIGIHHNCVFLLLFSFFAGNYHTDKMLALKRYRGKWRHPKLSHFSASD